MMNGTLGWTRSSSWSWNWMGPAKVRRGCIATIMQEWRAQLRTAREGTESASQSCSWKKWKAEWRDTKYCPWDVLQWKNGEQTLLYCVVSIYPNSHRISSPISSQGWKVPKANEEFEDFLVSSQSSICDKDNESCATALDVLTPFQRLHLTPLHALVILTREKNVFLSPVVTVNVSAKALQYNFPDEPLTFNTKEKSTKMTVPSSLFLSNYSFTLKCANPLFPAIKAGISSDMLRPLLSIPIQALGMEWSVANSKYEDELGLPAFPGIVCKVSFLSEWPSQE